MNTLIEVNGKKYVNTATAAEFWGVSSKTVCDYCKKQRVPGAIKLDNKIWCIPCDAVKPLNPHTIRKLLLSILMLKNNSNTDLNSCNIDVKIMFAAIKYLFDLGYIENFDIAENSLNLQMLRNIVLTEKGMNCLDSYKNEQKFDWSSFLSKSIPALIKMGLDYILN